MSTITISDLNAENFLSELTADELALVQGGGMIKDAWDVLNEAWVGLKTGFVDGITGK